MKRSERKKRAKILISVLMALLLIVTAVYVVDLDMEKKPVDIDNPTTTQKTEITWPAIKKDPPPEVTSTVTVRSAGDVLIHIPIYENARRSDGSYDFSHLFTYSKDVMSSCDYFVANLETTLGGTDGRSYSGFPRFNSPDSIASALKGAGVDCLLTANNHSYDTNGPGVIRTLEIIDNLGLDHTGTAYSPEDPEYLVKNLDGIKFGFACYTYETETTQGRKALNGILVDTETAELINSFDYNNLEGFYSELESNIEKMKTEGAEVIAVYIHWGEEYQLTQNAAQKEIAQKLCDLGVDVIIGGHPHVVQPLELITSTDGKHKAVCVYSLGNIVSNQRRSYMGLKTGHTEDGLIFEMTFSKYSDGTVTFDSIDCIPTWVHLYTQNGRKVHAITPLQGNLSEKAAELGLNKTSSGVSMAKASYERTMALVGEGEKKCNKYLASIETPIEKYEAENNKD